MISIQDTTLVACVEHGIQRLKTKCYTWTFPQSIVYEENDGMWALGGNFYLPSKCTIVSICTMVIIKW